MLIPSVNDARPGDVLRAKWMFDGCTTLAEVADRLETAAVEVRSLAAAGWSLSEPVHDDYGFLVDPLGNKGSSDVEDLSGLN